MKNLNNYIIEKITVNKGTVFSEKESFKLDDWNKWKQEVKSIYDINVYEDIDTGVYTVYIKEKHIATYIVNDQILYCDNKKIFGL